MLDLFNLTMLIGGGAGRDRARNEAAARAAAELVALAHAEAPEVLERLDANADGLNPEQVEERLDRFGANVVAQEKPKPVLLQLLERFITNPINILMAVFVAHFQEARSSRAVEQLRRMVSNTATVRREAEELRDGNDDESDDDD